MHEVRNGHLSHTSSKKANGIRRPKLWQHIVQRVLGLSQVDHDVKAAMKEYNKDAMWKSTSSAMHRKVMPSRTTM